MAERKPDSPASMEMFERASDIAGRAQQMILEFWAEQASRLAGEMPDMPGGADALAGMTAMWTSWATTWMSGMSAFSAAAGEMPDATGRLVRQNLDLWLDPESRAKAAGAGEDPLFDLIRLSYLLASQYVMEVMAGLNGVPDEVRRRLRFQAKQFVEAMNPANFAFLNPEVIETARRTQGESLLKGLANLLADLRRGKLTMTDESAFELGRNLAATPGKVIFENRMFQLIQYSPTTKSVHEIPILIFPPWINKFYILDLTAEKSLVRWLVAQGYTVFMVSWRQASPDLADVILDTYVQEGQAAAIDAAIAASGAPAVHVVGYCVAGTTLAVTLAWLAAQRQDDKVRSATFFTAQVDFTDAGELRAMVDEQMVASLEALAGNKGFLDGRWLAASFNLLRPADLIWNYVVRNYLLARDPPPFDLLYWNSDPTNVPARWHRDYLRQFYIDNLLVQPGAIAVGQVPIDLAKVETPVYIQAGRDDHIAPARSSFRLTGSFSGAHRFVLAGSGHIAGVVNPPAAGKYCYWSLDEGEKTPATYEAFVAKARETKGSWWPDWDAWLKPMSGREVPARIPGATAGFAAIEDAPGRYVKERIV